MNMANLYRYQHLTKFLTFAQKIKPHSKKSLSPWLRNSSVQCTKLLLYIKHTVLVTYIPSHTLLRALYFTREKPSDPPLQDILNEADELFNENKYSEAYLRLQPYENDKEVDVLWRLARIQYSLSKKAQDVEEKKKLIFQAYEHVAAALHISDNNFAVHKWMSVLLHEVSGYTGTKETILQSPNVKRHMEKAIELNPSDATTVYMLGSWCFQVADLPWYQRKLASAIFATPPNSSYEEALYYFQKAEKMDPHFYSMNLLMLGKCYLKTNDKKKAEYYLLQARDYPARTDDDRVANTEAGKLLKEMGVKDNEKLKAR